MIFIGHCLCAVSLSYCDCAEGSEEGGVNDADVAQECANNVLEVFYLRGCEWQ